MGTVAEGGGKIGTVIDVQGCGTRSAVGVYEAEAGVGGAVGAEDQGGVEVADEAGFGGAVGAVGKCEVANTA